MASNLKEQEYREIFTERLRLRTLRIDDAEALMPLLTDHEVMQWTSHPAVLSLAEAKKWVSDRACGDILNCVIELRDTHPSPIVGIAGYFRMLKIGYMISTDYAGHGYATEAMQALIPEIWKKVPPLHEDGTGFDHMDGRAYMHNKASRRILEKLGFKLCEIELLQKGDKTIEVAITRLARPGRSLEELGLISDDVESSS